MATLLPVLPVSIRGVTSLGRPRSEGIYLRRDHQGVCECMNIVYGNRFEETVGVRHDHEQ